MGGVGDAGMEAGWASRQGGAGPGVMQPPVYQPAQYSTPYKVDPARLSTIGPIVEDHAAPQVPGVSIPQPRKQAQQAGQDPAAQARLLSLLTHRLASAPCEDTLLQLIDLAAQVGPGPWEAVFGSLLHSLLHRVRTSPSAPQRELGMLLVEKLAFHQPQLVRAPGPLQALLPAVLACEADASKEVMLAASHAIASLVMVAPPQKVLDILSAMLSPSPPLPPSHNSAGVAGSQQGSVLDAENGGEVACAACRCVQRLAHSMPAEELAPRIALDLLPGLIRACDHVRADVRKAAVFAIAEMWHKLGDAGFSVHLAKLSQQQQHLVSWAHERIKLASCSSSSSSSRPPTAVL